MYYTYIIRSQKTKRYYVGSTRDVYRRLQEHNSNNTKSLVNKGPYILVYKEEFITKSEAVNREKQIKSYKGGNAFKKLFIV